MDRFIGPGPGEPVSRRDLRDVALGVSNLYDQFALSGIERDDTLGSPLLRVPKQQILNIRILSGTNPYAWEGVFPADLDGNWNSDGSSAGTVDVSPAIERQGRTDIKAQTVVEATLDEALGVWFFDAPVPKTKPEFFLARITSRAWRDTSLDTVNYQRWSFGWEQWKVDSTAITLNAGEVVSGAYPASGTVAVGPGILGTSPAEIYMPAANGATGGAFKLKLIVTVGMTVNTYTTANIAFNAVVADAVAALVAVEPAGVTVTGYVRPGGRGLITAAAAGPTLTSIVIDSSTITPSTTINPAIETSDFAVNVGRIVLMKKAADGTPPTDTIVKTVTGNGTSTHTAWSVTLANAYGGSRIPIFDGVKHTATTITYNASAATMQTALNAAFTPATFTVSGSDGGPYTVTCTSDFADHDYDEDADGLLDSGVYEFSAPYLGPRYGPGLSDFGSPDLQGPNAGGFNTTLYLIGLGELNDVYSVPVDGGFAGSSGSGYSSRRYLAIDLDGNPLFTNFLLYEPTTPTDWAATDPDNVTQALDRLAAYVGALEARVAILDGGTNVKP